MFYRLSVFGFLLFFTALNAFSAPSQWQRPNGKIDHELEIVDLKQQLKYLDNGIRGFNIVYDCWNRTYDVVLEEVQENNTTTTTLFNSYTNTKELVEALLNQPKIGFSLKNTVIEPKLKEFESGFIAAPSLQLDTKNLKIDVLQKEGKLSYLSCDSERKITRTDDIQNLTPLDQATKEVLQKIEQLNKKLQDKELTTETASLIVFALTRKSGVPFAKNISQFLQKIPFQDWPLEIKKNMLALLAWSVQPTVVAENRANRADTSSLFHALAHQNPTPQQYWELIDQMIEHYYQIMTNSPIRPEQYWPYRYFLGSIFYLNNNYPEKTYKKLIRFFFDQNPMVHQTGFRILSYMNEWPEWFFDYVTQDILYRSENKKILKLISTRSFWPEKMKGFVLEQLKKTDQTLVSEAILILGDKKTWNNEIWAEVVQIMNNQSLIADQGVFNALIRALSLRTEVPALYQEIYKNWMTTKSTTNERDFYRQIGRREIDPLMQITPAWTQKTICKDLSQTIKIYQSLTNSTDGRMKSLDSPLQIMAEVFVQERSAVCLENENTTTPSLVEKILSSENLSESNPFTLSWIKSLPSILDRTSGQFEDVDILYSRIFYSRLLTYFLKQNLYSNKYHLKEKAAEHLIRLMNSMVDVSYENFTKGIHNQGILGSNIQMYAQALMFSTLIDMVQVLDFTSYYLEFYRQTRAKLMGLYQYVFDSFYKIIEKERPGQWGVDYSSISVSRLMYHSIGLQETRARTASWLAVLRRANTYMNPTLSRDKQDLLDRHLNKALEQAIEDRYLLLHIFNHSEVPHDETEMQTGSHYLFANILLLTKELVAQQDLKEKRKEDLKKLWNVYRRTYNEEKSIFSNNRWWEDTTRRMNTLMAGISLIDYLALPE